VDAERRNVDEAMPILGLCNRRTVEAMAAWGEIPSAAEIGRRWTFHVAALHAFVKERKRGHGKETKSSAGLLLAQGRPPLGRQNGQRVRVRWPLETDNPKIAKERREQTAEGAIARRLEKRGFAEPREAKAPGAKTFEDALTMWLPRGSRSPGRKGRLCWSVIPTAALSSPKPARTRKVAGLVYIAAFAPDKGESVESLIKNPPPGAPVPPILPPVDGYLFLDATKFRASFAADVSEAKAAFMADSQVPWGVAALSGTVTEPAWKAKPSWYLVATEDKMIPPPAQRQMAARAGATVAEAAGSHAIYVSKPEAAAALIAKAAKSVSAEIAVH
jgi:hypothetical protein